jgi:uncharacterized protein YbjT (DUF2867 family)
VDQAGARLMAAADRERRRLERDLHDGPQQRLVSLSVRLRLLACRLAPGSEAERLLADARNELAASLRELRDLARGTHPAILSDRGLPAALEALTARAPLSVELLVEPGVRAPEPVEVAAYYLVSEALTNILKHSDATSAGVSVARRGTRLVVEVVDDGGGGADRGSGSGLGGLTDRIQALGGRLEVSSSAGAGTTLRAEIPLEQGHPQPEGASMTRTQQQSKPILVVGGTGKIGRRVVERLTARGLPVRVGSRSGDPRFDWEDRSTWGPVLEGVGSAYVTHYWDAIPGAAETLGSFADLAVERGVRRLVLLSGRGEEEAERAERAVRDSGAELTVLRSTWFAQNFSENYWREQVQAGELALPAAEVPEPFVDADDVADVAVAALTDDRHVGQVYELTGPRLLTFAEAVLEISRAVGREIRYLPISIEEFAAASAEQGVPGEVVEMLTFIFGEVLDGRNSHVTDGVRRALGREPRDFGDYARHAVASGIWNPRPAWAA